MKQTVALCILVLFVNGMAQKRTTLIPDSVLSTMTVDQLKEYKNQFQTELDQIQNKETSVRTSGVEKTESLLSKYVGSRAQDKILIRLAEYYYDLSFEEMLAKSTKYTEDLEKFDKGLIKEEPVLPKRDYSRVLQSYETIIEKYPDSEYIDDAVYNRAFIFEEQGNREVAARMYRELIEKFPNSRYAPEAYMRLAEQFFNPPVNEIDKAVRIYRKILTYNRSQRYDEALYKLGWSYYKLSQLPEAVAYFTLCVEDIDRAKQFDPEGKISRPEVRDEALQYIAASFAEDALPGFNYFGVENCQQYIEKVGKKPYGAEILYKLGEAYRTTGREVPQAIDAYKALLAMYPFYEKAPEAQDKVAVAYYQFEGNLTDKVQTYAAKDAMATMYVPNTEWFKTNIENTEVIENATKLVKDALKYTIAVDFQRATAAKPTDPVLTQSNFGKLIDHSRQFLKIYPDDTSAYEIHWNMAQVLDFELNRFEDAYKEYITVSNEYDNDTHREVAAKNAISVADTLFNINRGPQPEVKFSDIQKDTLRELGVRKELSTYQVRQLEACENYIRLFPDGPLTPDILSKAGSIYYNNNMLAEARIYFNTLVDRFPKSNGWDTAMEIVMDSYFLQKNYTSSEVIAKRIAGQSTNEEKIKKAKGRLAESIFLHAGQYAANGQHIEAGNEYRRVVTEVPDDPRFLDIALYNGALEFEKAKAYDKAVETFDQLVTNYPKSKEAINALNNMAVDYLEGLKDKVKAAATFERLFDNYPDSEKAELALFNASVYFKEAEDWDNAIRAAKKYINKYPDQQYSKDLFFEIANIYLKKNDLENANAIYNEFSTKYPNDPRTVETFYKRGEYFLKNNQLPEARTDFSNAVARSDELKLKNFDPNNFYAAEALFKVADLDYKEYRNIALVQPQNILEQNKTRKKELLTELDKKYRKIMAYGTTRVFETAYKLSSAYEEFADTYAHQELATDLTPDKKLVEGNKIANESGVLYNKAVDAYKQTVIQLDKLIIDLTAKQKEKAAIKDTTGRAAVPDSSIDFAHKFVNLSREKISYLIFNMAEGTSKSIFKFLEAAPPANLSLVQRYTYRQQILVKGVAPAIQKTVAAHERNLIDSKELNLKTKYLEESKNQIINISNVLPIEFNKLTIDAINDYKKREAVYRELTQKGDDATIQEGKQKLFAADIKLDLDNLIDYVKTFTEQTLKTYRSTLEKARNDSITVDAVPTTMLTMFRTAYEVGLKEESSADSARALRDIYKKLLATNPQVLSYEDASYAYDDHAVFFTDAAKTAWQNAYTVKEDMGLADNEWDTRILVKLARSSEIFAEKLGFSKKAQLIFTDNSWKANHVYREGWPKPEFNDSSWVSSATSGFDVSTGNATLDSAKAIWTAEHPEALSLPTAVADSTQGIAIKDTSQIAHSDSLSKPVPAAPVVSIPLGTVYDTGKDTMTVYFRTAFDILGLPTAGSVTLVGDDHFFLFANGDYIAEDTLKWKGDTWMPVQTYDITASLKKGKNFVGISVVDYDNLPRHGLRAFVRYQAIPEITEDMVFAKRNIKKSQEIQKVELDPVTLYKLFVLHKRMMVKKK